MLPQDEFIVKANKFRAELDAVEGFQEVHKLWQRTSIPYMLTESDPKSVAYKNEVLSVYERLAEKPYAIQNEMTSTLHESGEAFELGYPWTSQNLEVILQEMAKVTQAFRALDVAGASGKRIIEFGSGWGNLAVPLAKAGQDITVVDIDPRLLARIDRICRKDDIQIKSVESDFLEVFDKVEGKFDAVIFQASFHHCIDFDHLLNQITNKLLTDTGSIFFFSEPVFDGYAFPWGVRYDGESLWAVMCNKWLELGFDQSFFSDLLFGAGLFLTRIPEVPGYIGHGWRGAPSGSGVAFSTWVMPKAYEETFHQLEAFNNEGRYSRSLSLLPPLTGLARSAYRLVVRNYAPHAISFSVSNGRPGMLNTLNPLEERVIWVTSGGKEIIIQSETFCPDQCIEGNTDSRALGIYVVHVSTGDPDKPPVAIQPGHTIERAS